MRCLHLTLNMLNRMHTSLFIDPGSKACARLIDSRVHNRGNTFFYSYHTGLIFKDDKHLKISPLTSDNNNKVMMS